MLKPLHDRVVVKRLPLENKSPGGIHIPDNAAEKPEQGEVLAIGPGKFDSALVNDPVRQGYTQMSVWVGAKVLFGKYSGQTVKLNGADDILVMREEDILGILE